MEIKKLSADQDFQSVINNINDYLKKINDYQVNHQSEFGLPIEELGQFRKSWFYHNWQTRFRKIQAFNGLGLTGVINTPNTTFEEWLWWFHEWAESFMDDYNKFKELMFQALLVIEKHLEAVDTELQDHENRITDNTSRLDGDDVKLNEHEQHLQNLDKGLADETKARQDADNAEKNARISKDNDLQNQINAEKGAREQKDDDLQNQINQEKTERQNADRDLDTRVTNNTRAISNIAKISMKVGFDHNIVWNEQLLASGWEHTPYYAGQDNFSFAYSYIDTDGDNIADYLSFNTYFNGWKKAVNSTKPQGYWGSVSDPNYRERYGYEMINFNASSTDAKLDKVIKYLSNTGNDFIELNGVKYNKVINWSTFLNNSNLLDHQEGEFWYILPCVTPQGTLRMLLLTQGGDDLVNKEVRFNDMRYSEPQYIDIKGANIEI